MAAPAITGTAQQGSLLSVSVGDWTNSPTSFTRQWMRCDAAGANAVAIPSATGTWYRLTADDVGKTMRCWITSFNAADASAPVLTAQTGVVSTLAAAVPVLVVPPVITGALTVGSTLTISNGSWVGSPTRYGHCWQRCDSAGANCANIANGQDCSNATPNDKYVLVAADVGKKIKCYTTAVNATGNSIPVLSVATAVITQPATPPPQPGTLIWDGGFDTANESQWSYIHRYAADRFRVTAAVDGVTPRKGSYMARIEARNAEPSSWASTLTASIAQKGGLPSNTQLGSDVYMGWSVYVPSSFAWQSSIMHSTMAEWHGTGGMSQAPFHFGILGQSGHWFIDLHTAVAGYSPVFGQPSLGAFGPATANRWIDCVLRILWKADNSGRLQFWMDGVLRWDWTGRTWSYSTQSGFGVYPMLGLYCENKSPTKVMYVDAMKVGTTYAVVAP